MSDCMLSFPTEGADDVKGNLLHFITGANTAVLINIAECEGKDTGGTFIETYDDVMEIFNDILKQFGGGVIAHADASGFLSEATERLMNRRNENMKCKEALKFIKKIAKTKNIDDLREVMSPAEYAYVNNKKSKEDERIEYSWNYEHLYALEWALGLNEWNMPVDICNVGKCLEIMSKFSSIDDIINNSNMRSKKEILDKADLIYRMDWVCVDAWIHGLTGPAQLNPGVTQARHKTLNWLINMDDAEWDDVSTPT